MNTIQPDLEARRAAHLVETDWLAARLDDSDIRIVDMRGYVRTQTQEDGCQTATYIGAPEEYALSHLPGANYLDWTRIRHTPAEHSDMVYVPFAWMAMGEMGSRAARSHGLVATG